MHSYLKQLLVFASLFISVGHAETNFSAYDPPTNDMPLAPKIINPELESKQKARLWNLQDADILSIINEVSQETGKNFVVDPRVSGKITLVSSKPIRQQDLYQVFLAILGMMNYSAIPSGNVIKIVPNMESGELATKVVNKFAPGKGDETVVRVIPITNVSATQLVTVLRPLLPQWSNISVYAPGNVIILLGRAANLERINRIIQEVDKATTNGIQIIPLRQASAVQVANVLINLQNATRNSSGESPSISIAVDERSNSILLSGPKSARLKMQVLIAQLDGPTTANSGNTEVIYLRYLEAKTLAPILSKIAQNIIGGKENPRFSDSAMNNQINNGSGQSLNTAHAKEAVSFNSIQAEPTTNAIVITAPPDLMHALKAVVAKLDVRPAQVLVETVIAEVNEANLLSLGIQWGSITPKGTVAPSSPIDFAAPGAGVLGIIPRVNLRAILSILQNQNGVDILSTPSVVVLDNQKATIEVGQDIPESTGQYQTAEGQGVATPFTTIGRKKVTLKLEVTPQINLGSSVKLKLNLKNDTLQNPQNFSLTPLINTSSIINTVIINSDDVLVLGGLIKNTNNENINKVPILSSLPIIGPLFIQKTKDHQKKNLMVFIKPIIMNTNEEATMISHYKYTATRRTQANFRDELSNIGNVSAPVRLPPWKNRRDLPTPFESPI